MLKRKYKILVILIISLLIFTACDNTEESLIKDQKHLSLALNNDYSVKSLTPGDGRYSYDQNSVAEIKFELNAGYEFEGWEGDAKSRLAAADEKNSYQLKMTEDSQLTLETILNDFKLLKVYLGDIRDFSYSEGMEITDFPYDLEELRLKFNNKVNENNELYFEIKEDTDSDPIVSSDDFHNDNDLFTIEENKIILNWENFNSVGDGKIEFGKDYKLIISESGNKEIFDPELNEISSEIRIDIKMEIAQPEKVENPVLSTEDNKLELSWLRSERNKDDMNEDYVSKYIIYEFNEEGDFSLENAEREIEVQVENPADKKIVRKIIYEGQEFEKLDLENNTYYYRVAAVNEKDKKSELSEVVSTD